MEETGSPGDPPVTQWVGDKIDAARLREGRHILYRDSTSPGQSGSPLYFIEGEENTALVVGVHVGGNRNLGNCAVPISYHMTPVKTWIEKSSMPGNVDIFIFFC